MDGKCVFGYWVSQTSLSKRNTPQCKGVKNISKNLNITTKNLTSPYNVPES